MSSIDSNQDASTVYELAHTQLQKKEFKKAFENYLQAIHLQPEFFNDFYSRFKSFVLDENIYEQLKMDKEFLKSSSNIELMNSFQIAVERYIYDNLMDIIFPVERTINDTDISALRKLKKLFPVKYRIQIPFIKNEKHIQVPSPLDEQYPTLDDWRKNFMTMETETMAFQYDGPIALVDEESEKKLSAKLIQWIEIRENYFRKSISDTLSKEEEKEFMELHKYVNMIYQNVDNCLRAAREKKKTQQLEKAEEYYIETINILEKKENESLFIDLHKGKTSLSEYVKNIKVELSDIYYDQLMFFIEKGNYDRARKNADKFAEIANHNVAALTNYCLLMIRFNKLEEALEYGAKALEKSENDSERIPILINIGDIYANFVQTSLQSSPRNFSTLKEWAHKAILFYSKALEIDIENSIPQENKNIISFNLNNLKQLYSKI